MFGGVGCACGGIAEQGGIWCCVSDISMQNLGKLEWASCDLGCTSVEEARLAMNPEQDPQTNQNFLDTA